MENEKGAGGAEQTPAKVPATPEEQQQQGAAEQQQQNPFPAGNVDTQRFLFLDVDGVLHPTSCLTKEAWFDERCMANFKRIVDATQVGSTCNQRGVRSRNVVSYTVCDGTFF